MAVLPQLARRDVELRVADDNTNIVLKGGSVFFLVGDDSGVPEVVARVSEIDYETGKLLAAVFVLLGSKKQNEEIVDWCKVALSEMSGRTDYVPVSTDVSAGVRIAVEGHKYNGKPCVLFVFTPK